MTDDRRAGAAPAADGGEPSTEQVLTALVGRLGLAVLQRPDVLAAELRAACPDAGSDIDALLAAVSEQVPDTLLSVADTGDRALLAPRLERRLVSRRSLNGYAAAWAVRSWTAALSAQGPVAAPIAGGPVPGSAPRPPTASSDPEGTPASRAAAAGGSPGDDAPRSLRGRWTRVVASGIAATALLAIALHLAVDDGRSTTGPVAPAVDRGGSPTVAEAGASPAIVSPRAVLEPTTATVAPAVAAEPVRPVVTTAVIRPAGDTAPPPAPLPPTPVARPRIVAVTPSEPLVGDGRRRAVYAWLERPRDDVQSIAIRFVDGDEALRSASAVVAVPQGLAHDAPLLAGMIGARTARPIEATFDLVATLVDGTQTTPFRQRLSVAPAIAGDADAAVRPAARDSPPRRVATRTAPADVGTTAHCRPTACGSVVSVHEVADDGYAARVAEALLLEPASVVRYDVRVRTDAHTTMTVRQPIAWKTGARVRVVDGNLTSIDAAREP